MNKASTEPVDKGVWHLAMKASGRQVRQGACLLVSPDCGQEKEEACEVRKCEVWRRSPEWMRSG